MCSRELHITLHIALKQCFRLSNNFDTCLVFLFFQILLHKNDWHGSKDVDGCILPTLVYMAREKRPQYHTHYKAGAINSLVV